MNIEELANLVEINNTDKTKVVEIANDIINNGWNGTPILTMFENQALTGSHRIHAARYLMELDEESGWELGYGDIDVDSIDVSEYVSAYCERTGCDFDYGNLEPIFKGTDIEEIVKQNQEW